MDNSHHPTNVLQSIHTHSKKAQQFVRKFVCIFFNPMSLDSNIFFFYLGGHGIEVLLKQSFLLMGPKELVPLSKSPTYPESQLREVFLVNLVRKFK